MSSPIAKTPESYLVGLRRKDSKNALTTCRGVTDRGRACRRSLASPKNSSRYDGAVVITDNDEDPAMFFCHQHKAQAEHLHADEGSVVSIQGRHSLEEVFRNLGLEDVDEEAEASPSPPLRSSRNDAGIPEPSQTVAHDYATDSRPERTTPRRKRSHDNRRKTEAELASASKSRPSRGRPIEESRPAKNRNFFSSLIMSCFSDEPVTNKERLDAPRPIRVDSRRPEMEHTPRPRPSDEYVYERPKIDHRSSNPAVTLAGQQILSETPSPRIRRRDSDRRHDSGVGPSEQTRKHRRRPSGAHHRSSQNNNLKPSSTSPDFQVYNDNTPSKPPRQPYLNTSFSHSESPPALTDHRPSILHSKSTPDPQQLGRMPGEWPPPLPRQASDFMRICYAKLLTAMSEPPSKTDAPGYIYIFWQTEIQQTDDETSAVASIISAPASQGLKRQETILQRRFFDTSVNAHLGLAEVEAKIDSPKTLFLKIGRATNVHQRLTQWKKQCEYDISLLRSYPYEKRRGEQRRVPNVVKVERLIHLHLEMLGMRVKKSCRCGTEHKEWFEVGASAGSVREVDGIVRGWVQWSVERFEG
ncbi:Metal resistance protein [Venturia nashicola]|uniref:Metal resistance protein n=1 Tax=Venturia nashicola TaxID=86259 RepID=A0A4Z1NTX3_9PEZI|nr:Metal resistance protein [Venturia nashicola]